MEVTGMRPTGPEEMQTEMERFFAHLERWKRPVYFFEKTWTPLCDVSENAGEVIVVAELAGVSSGDIGIKVVGDTLVLSGVRREPRAVPRRYRQMEISYGTFERTISLPSRVEADKARATYEEGFLEIRLPKVTRKPRREVDVDVSTE